MDNIPGWLSNSLSKLGSFFSIDMATILALVLFFLGYQLFRLAIVGILQRSEPPEIGRSHSCPDDSTYALFFY